MLPIEKRANVIIVLLELMRDAVIEVLRGALRSQVQFACRALRSFFEPHRITCKRR